jgi:biopolymer transport protein ExbD
LEILEELAKIMRFKNRQQHSSMPEVNLVPMMDVMMAVLTFFIVVSMVLTGEQLGDIDLPGAGGGEKRGKVEPLYIGLDEQGKLLLENRTINEVELASEIRAYSTKNPGGTVILQADRDLPYKQVSQLLKKMAGTMGGTRVSLAIQHQ